MLEKTIVSRVDPRDGFTLHQVEIDQWIHGENLQRLDARKPFVRIHGMSTFPRGTGRVATSIKYE